MSLVCHILIPFYNKCSDKQESLYVSLCDWAWRFRKGMEGRKKEREETICNEGNAQGAHYSEALGQLRHERKEVLNTAHSPVSGY